MSQTITALFDNRGEATAAVNELIKAGVSRSMIKVTPETDIAPATTSTGYDTSRDDKGFWASLSSMFMPEEDRYSYAEAMHRGSIMVAATVDDTNAARAEDILEQHGTVELDQREKTWRNEGWKGGTAALGTTATMATAAKAPVASTAAPLADTRAVAGVADDKIHLAEERLQVGKRQVDSGRVKIRSYVVETPVSQDVKLRTETLKVDRVSADRALAAGEDPFKERTIEATAMSEQAVVSKDVRVTGEVRVAKTADERVETVHDTVRSTKVDVDDGQINNAGVKPAVVATPGAAGTTAIPKR